MADVVLVPVSVTRSKGLPAYAMVDADIAADLLRHVWHASKRRPDGTAKYAARYDANGRLVRMHRYVLGLDPDSPLRVDHVDGNGLNNTRANLRVVTHAQNMQNRRMHSNNTSGARGVYRHQCGRWVAVSRFNGKIKYLGLFDTVEQAALVASRFRAAHMPFSADALGLGTN